MRLSEAIRLGAMLKPQCFGRWYSEDETATCALGAARDAGYVFDAMVMTDHHGTCPDCQRDLRFTARHPLAGIVTHLNDLHRWTRERIADWLEQQELASERHEALTNSTSDVRGTTEMAQPVLTTRV